MAHSSRRTSKGSPGHPGGIIHAIGPRVEGAAAWSGRHATCPLSRSRFASRELFQNRARRSADGYFSVISQPTTFILEAKLSAARSPSRMRTRLRAAATRRPQCGDGTDALSSRVFSQDTRCVIIRRLGYKAPRGNAVHALRRDFQGKVLRWAFGKLCQLRAHMRVWGSPVPVEAAFGAAERERD